jgi:hypothetical protein
MERAPEAVRSELAQVDGAVLRNEPLPGTRLWWAEPPARPFPEPSPASS